MKEVLEQRLVGLKQEYESGQKLWAELDAKQQNIRQTMLRIEGAMQLIKEVLEASPSVAA